MLLHTAEKLIECVCVCGTLFMSVQFPPEHCVGSLHPVRGGTVQ